MNIYNPYDTIINKAYNLKYINSITELPFPTNTTQLPVTFDGDSNKVLHPYGEGVFADGQPIEFVGDLPYGLSSRYIYFAYGNDASGFYLSSTFPLFAVTSVTIYDGEGLAQVAGEITPEDGVTYNCNSLIFTPYDIVFSGQRVRFESIGAGGVAGIAYTGLGSLFSGEIAALDGFSILFTAPYGKLFDNISAVDSNSYIYLASSILNDIADLGNINDIAHYFSEVTIQDVGQGFTFTDVIASAIIQCTCTGWKNNADTVMFSYYGDCGTISFPNGQFVPNPNETIYHFDPEMTTYGVTLSNTISSNLAGGTVFTPTSKDQTDIYFSCVGNVGIPDSVAVAVLSIQDNALETEIDDIDIPKRVNAVYNITGAKERFLLYENGDAVYIGLETRQFNVSSICTLKPQTGVNIVLSSYILKVFATPYEFTFDAINDLLIRNEHGLSNDDSLCIGTTGTLGEPITNDNVYYVVNATTNNFQLSLEVGGTPIDITTTGTGTHSYKFCDLRYFSESFTTASSTGRPGSTNSTDLISLSTGDKLITFCANEDTVSNIICVSVQMKITD